MRRDEMMVVMGGKDTLIFVGLVRLLCFAVILAIPRPPPPFRILYHRTPRVSDLVSCQREMLYKSPGNMDRVVVSNCSAPL